MLPTNLQRPRLRLAAVMALILLWAGAHLAAAGKKARQAASCTLQPAVEVAALEATTTSFDPNEYYMGVDGLVKRSAMAERSFHRRLPEVADNDPTSILEPGEVLDVWLLAGRCLHGSPSLHSSCRFSSDAALGVHPA